MSGGLAFLAGETVLKVGYIQFGRGASSHGTRPYFHHRFGEGTNWNEGVPDYYVSQWKKWYHIVFTNSGLSGKYARTYVNGSFATGTQRYERRVLNELMVDYSSDLYIGAAPDHGNGGVFSRYY